MLHNEITGTLNSPLHDLDTGELSGSCSQVPYLLRATFQDQFVLVVITNVGKLTLKFHLVMKTCADRGDGDMRIFDKQSGAVFN